MHTFDMEVKISAKKKSENVIACNNDNLWIKCNAVKLD